MDYADGEFRLGELGFAVATEAMYQVVAKLALKRRVILGREEFLHMRHVLDLSLGEMVSVQIARAYGGSSSL